MDGRSGTKFNRRYNRCIQSRKASRRSYDTPSCGNGRTPNGSYGSYGTYGPDGSDGTNATWNASNGSTGNGTSRYDGTTRYDASRHGSSSTAWWRCHAKLSTWFRGFIMIMYRIKFVIS